MRKAAAYPRLPDSAYDGPAYSCESFMSQRTSIGLDSHPLELRVKVAWIRALFAATCLQHAILKYRPEQPRVPAGNPDGGQWTGDGTAQSEEPEEADPEIQLINDINGFTRHGINQAITRGVLPSAILDAVRNPLQVLPQANGSTRYIGADAVVVLNRSGQVITVWGR